MERKVKRIDKRVRVMPKFSKNNAWRFNKIENFNLLLSLIPNFFYRHPNP